MLRQRQRDRSWCRVPLSSLLTPNWYPDMARRRQHNPFAQMPRRQFIPLPLPPPPLGLSNYDVLDMEDELNDECCDGDGPLVYSDFNILEPVQPDYADYDSLPRPRRPPSPPDEKEVELILEQQRQRKLCFIQFA
jgi:hypothetical protein